MNRTPNRVRNRRLPRRTRTYPPNSSGWYWGLSASPPSIDVWVCLVCLASPTVEAVVVYRTGFQSAWPAAEGVAASGLASTRRSISLCTCCVECLLCLSYQPRKAFQFSQEYAPCYRNMTTVKWVGKRWMRKCHITKHFLIFIGFLFSLYITLHPHTI